MSVKNSDPNGCYSHAIVLALEESIGLLMEENLRHRRTIGILRRLNSELRRLKNIQVENDEEFKSMCQGDITIDADVIDGEGGLPEPLAS